MIIEIKINNILIYIFVSKVTNLNRFLVLAFLFGMLNTLNAQNHLEGNPFIQNYNYQTYNSHPTNFDIVQDTNGLIYVANNGGILIFDGVSWEKILLPENNAPLKLQVIDNNRVYVGCNNNFGYLSSDSVGKCIFISLLNKATEVLPEKFSIIQIFKNSNRVFFKSYKEVFYVENDSVYILNISGYSDIRDINGNLIVKINGKGLYKYELETNDLSYLPQTKKFSNSDDFFRGYLKDTILFFTKNSEFFLYNYNERSKNVYIEQPDYFDEIDTFIKENLLTFFKPYKRDQFIFGTYLNGFTIVSSDGSFQKHLNTESGLFSNYIRLIQTDNLANIWLTTDIGLSYLVLNTPFTEFSESTGIKEPVNDAIIHNNKLYISNNSGVFCLQKNGNFKKLNNENIYFNSFLKLDKYLYVIGSDIQYYLSTEYDNYVFEIDEDVITKLSNIPPIMHWIKLNNKEDYYIGLGEKFYLLKNENSKLKYIKTIKNSPAIEQFYTYNERLIQGAENDIWFNGRYEISQIYFNNKYDSIIEIKRLPQKKLPSVALNSIYSLKIDNATNKIICLSDNGIYYFNYEKSAFEPEYIFKDIPKIDWEYFVQDESLDIYLSGHDKQNGKNQIFYFRNTNNGFQQIHRKEFNKLGTYQHADPICLNKTSMLFRTPENFIFYNKKRNIDFDKKFKTLIRKVYFRDSLVFGGEETRFQTNIFPFQKNKIKIQYAGLFFEEHNKLEYSYKLEGFDKHWSGWNKDTQKEFINLNNGKYEFLVKARNIYQTESEVANYSFSILKPWYKTSLSYFSFLFVIVLLVFTIVRVYTQSLKRDKLRLEKQVDERTNEIKRKNELLIHSNEEITAQRDEIEAQRNYAISQKELIEDQQKSIKESISYAEKIQVATLPNEMYINEILPENFILYKPRDVVSGDFYWIRQIYEHIVIVAADCTGHGVPGAMLSTLGISLLNEIIQHRNILEPNKILDELRYNVKLSLRQTGRVDEAKDGMDVAICVLNTKTKVLQYAGAYNPLFLIRKSNDNYDLSEIKADRMPVGIYIGSEKPFTHHEISLKQGDTFYIFSDGYSDQMDGPKGKKFMIRHFKELLKNIQNSSMFEQKEILEQTLFEWRRGYEQIDDILVIGVRII